MKTLVVGIGSPSGTDQFGWRVLDWLAKYAKDLDGLTLVKSKGNGVDWFTAAESVDQLIFIDAIVNSSQSDEIVSLDISSPELLAGTSTLSSHGIQLVQSLRLLDSLGITQRRRTLIGWNISRSLSESGQVVSESILKKTGEILKSRLFNLS